MNEFVEKLAEALVNSWRQDSWANQTEIGKDNARHSVRAVLAAMREPTEAMCSAAGDDGHTDCVDAAEVWRAMIDTALKETK
jgi:hypothetical protein